MPPDEYMTPSFKEYGQAIKGREFPDWGSGGPAKYKLRESIDSSLGNKSL